MSCEGTGFWDDLERRWQGLSLWVAVTVTVAICCSGVCEAATCYPLVCGEPEVATGCCCGLWVCEMAVANESGVWVVAGRGCGWLPELTSGVCGSKGKEIVHGDPAVKADDDDEVAVVTDGEGASVIHNVNHLMEVSNFIYTLFSYKQT